MNIYFSMVRQAIIKQTYWTRHERYAVVDSLTKVDLMSLVRTFLDKLHMDCFVIGNFTTQVRMDVGWIACNFMSFSVVSSHIRTMGG